MDKSTLLEIVANGENSGVEFKRDDCRPEQLAKEVVAMANAYGGCILLGVEDDGSISGIQNPKLEAWVMDAVFGSKVHPMMVPFYEEIELDGGKRVAVISFPQGPSKPYVLRHNSREDIYIRLGSTSRVATREQQARLFATGGMIHAELLPVPGTTLECLDLERARDYLGRVLNDPSVPDSEASWLSRLSGLGLMAETSTNQVACTIAGLVLIGYAPRRYFRQAGIRLMAFDGTDKDYKARFDRVLDGPLVALRSGQQDGLIEQFSSHIQELISEESSTIGSDFRRQRQWHYPPEVIREVIINALAHRDWTRAVDIEITVYADRLECISPGPLPNSMTVEKMVAGQRSMRNQVILDVLRDYGYVDARGMGVRTKIIPLMRRENNVDPIFEATEDYVKTILPRGKAPV